MTRMINIAGKTINSWTALMHVGHNHAGRTIWDCVCECGTRRHVEGQSLREGKTKSCGCKAAISTSEKMIQPDKSRHASHYWSPEKKAWRSMRSRCSPNNTQLKAKYHDRGIHVCERWDNLENGLENFLKDMGPIPRVGFTLDRRDNDGIYEPRNCRWMDKVVQARNRRRPENWKRHA